MSELDNPTPGIEEQLGPDEEPQQEEEQSGVTEGDESERLDDVERELAEIKEQLKFLGNAVPTDLAGPPFLADAKADGTFQELIVVNGSLSYMMDGRANDTTNKYILASNFTGNASLMMESVDMDDTSSKSHMSWVLVGGGAGSVTLATITGHNGTGPTSWNPYTANLSIGGTANIYNGFEPCAGTPGPLGVNVGANGTVNGGSCVVQPIGNATVLATWDVANSRWAFSAPNSAQ